MNQFRRILSDCKKVVKGYLHKDIIFNCNHTDYRKRCLLIYITHPFTEKKETEYHQNTWQARELARIIGTFEYQVDVIDYRNRFTRPVGKYDLVIGLIPRGIDVYSKHLSRDAVKIAYLTSSCLQYTNQQEISRLDQLFERRGMKLQARRQAGEISKAIESFSGALFFGNDYNLKSYEMFKMPPTYYLANSGYDYDFRLKMDKDSHRFLFFGSMGQVHKGLDLLLEIFSKPGFPYELYVCGSVSEEKDFEEAYFRELYKTPNIHTIGFVDIRSAQFEDLVNSCAFAILPSCAEGQAGSVTTLMSAGVISICSRECGYNDDEVINLPDCRMETIERFIRFYAEKDPEWIRHHAEKALKTYREKHTKRSYTDSVISGLEQILTE